MTHFTWLSKLASSLEAKQVHMLSHRYDDWKYGSWVIVVGKKGDKLRIVWDGKEDGKESALIFYKALDNRHENVRWKFVEAKRFGPLNYERVSLEIETFLKGY